MPAPKDPKKYVLYCKRIGKATKKLWTTPEYRKRITNSLKGTKRPPFSVEWKRHIGESRKGLKPSKSIKRKLSKLLRERWSNPEYKKKLSISQKKKWSNPQFKIRMSLAHKGIKMPPFSLAHRKKLSEIAKKRVYSEETKKKISLARKKTWKSPEFIKKMQKRDEMMRNIKRSKQFKEKVSKSHLRLWKDKQFREKMMASFYHGSKHPQWQGGISFLPYSPEFNKSFKEYIRDKYNHQCFICKKSAREVHHINYNKKVTCEKNCVLLCLSHHGATNSNRDYWFAFFCYHLDINPEDLLN